MAKTKWKLIRQTFGTEEFTFSEGETVTIGRAISNTITFSSIVISRNHCVLEFRNDKVLITDLKSSNGVYIGLKKISQNVPHSLDDSDVIGFGWTIGAPLTNINDNEKYVFKLEKKSAPSIINRIQFQGESDFDHLEEKIAALETSINNTSLPDNRRSPVFNNRTTAKRKLQGNMKQVINIDNDVISILSDSDSEKLSKQNEKTQKKPKLESIKEVEMLKPEDIKNENEYLQFEAFNVKQEYSGYEEEPIQIDSDSDSESENWLLRLSQSSPGKPFMKSTSEVANVTYEDSSYSQLDDFIPNNSSLNEVNNDEDFLDDFITIPPQPPDEIEINAKFPVKETSEKVETTNELAVLQESLRLTDINDKDEVDGCKLKSPQSYDVAKNDAVIAAQPEHSGSKTQMIAPLHQINKKKSSHKEVKSAKSASVKCGRIKKHSSKKHISNSQKEERKKKLKALTTKDTELENTSVPNITQKVQTTKIKVPNSNRGAFLGDAVQIVKPQKRKDVPKESHKTKNPDESVINNAQDLEKSADRPSKKDLKTSKSKEKSDTKVKKTESNTSLSKDTHSDSRIPLKSLKPLTDSEETCSRKPVSKVEPLKPQQKPKKQVRFSDAAPEVRIFEIEPGNRMNKTSLVKTSLLDSRQLPVFSLEKITLMKILKWNPHWLEEQINNNDPPPILGHNNPPMNIFHTFTSHSQYIQLIGDLLLMEIWECLTIAYMKVRQKNYYIPMRVASIPPMPINERTYELFNISVDISLPTTEAKTVPRVGEILIVTFGPENSRIQRFFFVNNVRNLPSPPNNIHSFYNISLQGTFTEKMKLLKLGEVLMGKTLAYINKELTLFEAMEYLAGSPLSEAILRPEPHHFPKSELGLAQNIRESEWTMKLNPSQQEAVNRSVSAALGDRPSVQMVQGPPGTGKSSVICSIVMTYFYDASGKRQQNRGKILICATSNTAVDEIVIRLLKIRQDLPKSERFRMVRVGRAESMHPRARDVSSQQLALREARAAHDVAAHHPGIDDEITLLQAKINMWKANAQNAKDPVRVAYCQGRANDLNKRIAMVRAGGGRGAEPRPEQLAHSERRIVEGADIVATTLASAHNHKMKGLKRRIALCIIDEAGQAIEPETLIPLTLDVTNITLIGDPQQLPGYICSQRAKKHGLGESLFSRLSSCSEAWGGEGVGVGVGVLLDRQYRMQPAIADYPNRAFYGGRVSSSPAPRPPLPLPAYCILAIASGDKGQGVSGANEMEAWGVSRLAAALQAALPRARSLAVITPYNAHKDLVKKCIKSLQDPNAAGVEVNTVDSFQGQERDVVLVSLARSHGVGFLTDAGRMNVMLTRARHALIVCLNPHAMLKNNQWRTLVEDAQRRKLYKSLPNKMCQPPLPLEAEQDDILKYIS